jgi:hypothetical protein
MNEEEKQFPIQNGPPKSIPWEMIAPHEKQAFSNHNQSLKRLAERGGLSPTEAMLVLENRNLFPWIPDPASGEKLIALVQAYRQQK